MEGRDKIIRNAASKFISDCLSENIKPTFTAWEKAIGKPRMSQSDRWKNRPCVNNYWAYKNEINILLWSQGVKLPKNPQQIVIICYIEHPVSWPQKKSAEKHYTQHDQKPDCDNIEKGILDILFKEDKAIFCTTTLKFWCDKDEERIEVYIR